ncbi:unnamed protein product, partial [Allacma fusca]
MDLNEDLREEQFNEGNELEELELVPFASLDEMKNDDTTKKKNQRRRRKKKQSNLELKEFCCSICDRSFAAKSNLFRHIKFVHENERPVKARRKKQSINFEGGQDVTKCQACGRELKNSLALNEHLADCVSFQRWKNKIILNDVETQTEKIILVNVGVQTFVENGTVKTEK